MKRSAGGGEPSTGEGKRARSDTQPTSFFQSDTPNGAFETVDPAWEFCKLEQCRAMRKITSLLARNGKELFYSINADHQAKENLRVEILVRRSPGGESGLHYRVDKHYAGRNVEEAILTLSVLPKNRPPEVHVDGWYRDLSLKYAKKNRDSLTVSSLIFFFGILLADMVIKARHPRRGSAAVLPRGLRFRMENQDEGLRERKRGDHAHRALAGNRTSHRHDRASTSPSARGPDGPGGRREAGSGAIAALVSAKRKGPHKVNSRARVRLLPGLPHVQRQRRERRVLSGGGALGRGRTRRPELLSRRHH